MATTTTTTNPTSVLLLLLKNLGDQLLSEQWPTVLLPEIRPWARAFTQPALAEPLYLYLCFYLCLYVLVLVHGQEHSSSTIVICEKIKIKPIKDQGEGRYCNCILDIRLDLLLDLDHFDHLDQ